MMFSLGILLDVFCFVANIIWAGMCGYWSIQVAHHPPNDLHTATLYLGAGVAFGTLGFHCLEHANKKLEAKAAQLQDGQ